MWGKIILAFIVFALIVTVMRIAIVMLLIGGMLFRPRETFGLFCIFVMMWMMELFPIVTFSALGLIMLLGLLKWIAGSSEADQPKP